MSFDCERQIARTTHRSSKAVHIVILFFAPSSTVYVQNKGNLTSIFRVATSYSMPPPGSERELDLLADHLRGQREQSTADRITHEDDNQSCFLRTLTGRAAKNRSGRSH